MARHAVKIVLIILVLAAVAYGATAIGKKPAVPQVASSNSWSSAPASGAPAAPADSVWIARPDGAESCSTSGAQTLEQGAAELRKNKLRVLDSKKDNDGKMRAAMCGLPQGSLNAYLIPRAELAQAIALGFVEVKHDDKH
jgi:hypothetical protein